MLTYWFLSGFIAYMILMIYSFFIGVDSREDSLQEKLDIIIDYHFWITAMVASCLGFISFVVGVCMLILLICTDIKVIKERKKEFFEKTPWYQQKNFGGWKKYNSKGVK